MFYSYKQSFKCTDEEITQMLVLATVNVGGLAIAVPGISEDGCVDLSQGQCPAAPRERIGYSTDIEVLKDYPQVIIRLQF